MFEQENLNMMNDEVSLDSEEITEETLEELSNNKGEDDDDE